MLHDCEWENTSKQQEVSGMKITFLGAAKTVTGSCYFIETSSCKMLVDCGMFQGSSKEETLNEEDFPFNPSELNYVLLTHAHIDHSGRIPKLYVDGFKGEIIATKATKELCEIMLPDSGYIQESEAEWKNRKRQRAGKPPVKPLYTYKDAVDCLKLFRSVKYDEMRNLTEDIRVRFRDAGHILGSSIIELWIREKGSEIKVVFSGDLGNKNIPILRDPTIIEDADYLVIESTYGNKVHGKSKDRVEDFVNIINETIDRGGNVVIPSFAVGRTQEVIYDLNKKREKYDARYDKFFNAPVYVDSPLATSATEVFRRNLDCYDEEAREYIENGDNPLDFPGLRFTKTPEESKALNEKKESMVIISASGMCDAGRIKHHLKHNLWRSESTILFVGYQAEGTLGRRLLDGAKTVKIFGEEISVNARIEMLEGLSGHADKEGLMSWLQGFKKKPEKVFIVHGEENVMADFSEAVKENLGVETVIPERGQSFVIGARGAVDEAEKLIPDVSFKRLAVIDILETLKEEFDFLSDEIINDLKQDKEDEEVDKLRARLKKLESEILDVLKQMG